MKISDILNNLKHGDVYECLDRSWKGSRIIIGHINNNYENDLIPKWLEPPLISSSDFKKGKPLFLVGSCVHSEWKLISDE